MNDIGYVRSYISRWPVCDILQVTCRTFRIIVYFKDVMAWWIFQTSDIPDNQTKGLNIVEKYHVKHLLVRLGRTSGVIPPTVKSLLFGWQTISNFCVTDAFLHCTNKKMWFALRARPHLNCVIWPSPDINFFLHQPVVIKWQFYYLRSDFVLIQSDMYFCNHSCKNKHIMLRVREAASA